MKLRIFSFLMCVALLFSLSACVKVEPISDINIYTMNGTTGFGFAKLMNDAKSGMISTEKYNFTVKSDPADVQAALINGDADIAALPTNAAAALYQKTNGGVKILAINTLGCLYLLTKEGTTVSSFADLEGKTVYVPAQNPTFIFKYLLQKSGIQNVTVDSTSYAAAANLKDAVANGIIDIAVLPEPMVTIATSAAKKNNINITNAMDLTAEWNKVAPQNSLVQGCIVVRTAFLEANPEAVKNFMTAYEASIKYMQENVASAAQMVADNGIFENAQVAEKAIPKCNVYYMDGKDMKNAMATYLTELKTVAPATVVPDDAFYYMPQK